MFLGLQAKPNQFNIFVIYIYIYIKFDLSIWWQHLSLCGFYFFNNCYHSKIDIIKEILFVLVLCLFCVCVFVCVCVFAILFHPASDASTAQEIQVHLEIGKAREMYFTLQAMHQLHRKYKFTLK